MSQLTALDPQAGPSNRSKVKAKGDRAFAIGFLQLWNTLAEACRIGNLKPFL